MLLLQFLRPEDGFADFIWEIEMEIVPGILYINNCSEMLNVPQPLFDNCESPSNNSPICMGPSTWTTEYNRDPTKHRIRTGPDSLG